MAESAKWKQVIQDCDIHSFNSQLCATLTNTLRTELVQLEAGGQTDAQIQTALLSTYAPVLVAIASLKAQIAAQAHITACRHADDRAKSNGNLLN